MGKLELRQSSKRLGCFTSIYPEADWWSAGCTTYMAPHAWGSQVTCKASYQVPTNLTPQPQWYKIRGRSPLLHGSGAGSWPSRTSRWNTPPVEAGNTASSCVRSGTCEAREWAAACGAALRPRGVQGRPSDWAWTVATSVGRYYTCHHGKRWQGRQRKTPRKRWNKAKVSRGSGAATTPRCS